MASESPWATSKVEIQYNLSMPKIRLRLFLCAYFLMWVDHRSPSHLLHIHQKWDWYCRNLEDLVLAFELFQCTFHSFLLQIISFQSWQKGIFHMPLSVHSFGHSSTEWLHFTIIYSKFCCLRIDSLLNSGTGILFRESSMNGISI
jgi:hypothetical protein